jgi:hypothetical protein
MLAEGLHLTGDLYDYDANVRALLTAPTGAITGRQSA